MLLSCETSCNKPGLVIVAHRCAAALRRGRVRLQVMGFMWVFAIFLVCAIAYNELIKKQYIAVFQVRPAGVLELGVVGTVYI